MQLISKFLAIFCLGCLSIFSGVTPRHISPTTTAHVPPRPELPESIGIPSIHLQTQIEPVELDAHDRMDVPKDTNNVGWYALGARPGEVGNAVIDGHLDTATTAAIFSRLSEVHIGDTISIKDHKGTSYQYRVNRMITYEYDKLPLEDIFGKTTKRNLNLITCAGSYDSTHKNYSHRLVVYAEETHNP